MTFRTTALERAFQLARGGTCASLADIRKQLKAEGFSLQQIFGPTLSRQLAALCRSATRLDTEAG